MIVKEFRQLGRDKRTLGLLGGIPLLLLIVFGFAASFDVSSVPTVVYGQGADDVAGQLPEIFDVVEVDADGTDGDAESDLRRGTAIAGLVTGSPPKLYLDGTQLFAVQSIMAQASEVSVQPDVEVLFNPDLETSVVMVPAIIGLILLFVGTVATSLGVVRERQTGTLEQLAVMPLRASDIFVGKVAPYFVVGAVDMAVVVALGMLVFDVPFRGSWLAFLLGALLFIFVTLAIGVLISTVSENQGQAIQLAIMVLLPQVLLSGMIFPLESMAAGVRWIAYLLPLTYWVMLARGLMVKGTSLVDLWFPIAALVAMGTVVFTLAVVRFRRDLAPSDRRQGEEAPA
jgi:ABC-2 type transport system permease protein